MMNESEKIKKIPYGISDYEKLRERNSYYVDKTKYIREVENSPCYLFLIRPRRFGKSLWLSLMENYYDVENKDSFEELFKGTYIYENPTEERNFYLILKFDFSAVTSGIEDVENSFNEVVKLSVLEFVRKYKTILEDENDKIYKKIETLTKAHSILNNIISITKDKGKIYLLIDEYDNFTNTILSGIGEERYTAITHGEGFYRNFFNVIKAGTGDGVISKIFMTGVSPVTMDDVTSGFNIGTNITAWSAFNEIIGFTEEEVLEMLKYYSVSVEEVLNIIKAWCNNYLFCEGKNRLYNSDMVLYFISEYMANNRLPKIMLDSNIKTDYKKLKYLIITDQRGRLRINGNFEKLKMIIEEGEISSTIMSSFPAYKVVSPENFISLLYYLGLLTIKDYTRGRYNLIIPNESIRQIYYEYIRDGYSDTKIFNLDLFTLGDLFNRMAYDGDWESLIEYLTVEMGKQISLRDYIQGEKALQTFIRVYLNVSNYYITKTEPELHRGYGDIVLIPNLPQFPDLAYSYILEIKYMNVKEYKKKKLQEKIMEAKEELDKYKDDDGLKKLTGKTELKKLILIFAGVELKHKEEYGPV